MFYARVNTFEKIVAIIFQGRKKEDMPGKHSEETKLLGFYAKHPLVALVDQVRKGQARSQFLREAAVEYMEKRGTVVPADLKNAPDRAGKGGPIVYPAHKRGTRKLKK